MKIDESELRRALDEAAARRERKRERFESASERRKTLLQKAIEQNKVRVDYETVPADYDPRTRLQRDLDRLMRNGAEGPSEPED